MISGDFPPQLSGVGDYSWHISRTLRSLNILVTVITTRKYLSAPTDMNYYGLDVRPIINSWKWAEVSKIFKIIKEYPNRTVVNIQYYCPSTYGRRLFINFLPIILRIFAPSVKTIVTMHGFWEQSRLFRLRTLPMLRAAHGIIYVDSFNKDVLKRYSGFSDSKLMKIPIAGNIIPISCSNNERAQWRKEQGLTEKDIAIAFFGGIGKNKGFEYLVESLHHVTKLDNKLSFILYGIGGFHNDGVNTEYHEKIKRLISDFNLADKIKIIESPPPDTVSRYLHISDIAVYPFVNGVGENSGSMLAALAHGLPTIITSGPANQPDYTTRFGVHMVPPRDPNLLAEEIIKLSCSDEEREYMRKKALSVSKDLSWENTAKKTADFFRSI